MCLREMLKKRMRRSFVLVLTISLLFFGSKTFSADIEKGKEKSVTCVACHGVDGKSPNPIWPNLAGQHVKYLKIQLYEFRKGQNGKRNNAIMHGISLTLSDEDIESLALYYSSLEKPVGITKDKYLEKGQNIYRGGNLKFKIQACIACHGPNGQGNYAAAIPVLSGQHSEYIVQQLKNFQSGIRSNDPNKMMRNVVHRMTDEEIRSVAEYIEGLY
ncbi:MAG: c-type cytochrome [Pseudomonadota bacterium]|nr:c-type cytochrome [Pseudomonadota bacterium]